MFSARTARNPETVAKVSDLVARDRRIGLKLMDVHQIPRGNKLYIFSPTQNRFILTQIVPLYVCCVFRPVLSPSSGVSIQKLIPL